MVGEDRGIKTASQILGSAAFYSGFQEQDFPRYGAERRGAPIVAFTRISKDAILERGAIVVPGICGAIEYQNMTETQAFDRVKETIGRNTKDVLKLIQEEKLFPHDAALKIAKDRWSKAMALRAHM